MRTPIERDAANVVDILIENDHIAGRLENLVRVVVAGRQRRHAVIDDAPLLKGAVLPGVVLVPRLLHGERRLSRAPFRRHGRQSPVRRIDNQRGAPDRLAAVVPVRVIRAREVGFGGAVAAIGARCRILIERGHLLCAEHRFPRLVARPFQGRDRRVRPFALQVGLAPGRVRRRPVARGGRLPPHRDPGQCDQPDQDRQHPRRNKQAIAHREPPLHSTITCPYAQGCSLQM